MMTTFRSRLLIIAASALAAACNSPTSPSRSGYAGTWTGTTAQGAAISFVLSSDEMVTSITIGHNFNGCVGSQTFSDLRLTIVPSVVCIPGPCSGTLTSMRAFNYGSRDTDEGRATAINALFLATDRAEGTVNFRGFAGCGDAVGVGWTASKR